MADERRVYRVAAIPGDGIGPEVTEADLRKIYLNYLQGSKGVLKY